MSFRIASSSSLRFLTGFFLPADFLPAFFATGDFLAGFFRRGDSAACASVSDSEVALELSTTPDDSAGSLAGDAVASGVTLPDSATGVGVICGVSAGGADCHVGIDGFGPELSSPKESPVGLYPV